VLQTCGQAVPNGWWTADEVCALDSSYGAPFNCGNSAGADTIANLLGCAGAYVGDCYNSDTGKGNPNCCGCPNTNAFTPNNFLSPPWDAVVSSLTKQCQDSSSDWIKNAQPWVYWMKSNCPSTYTYPDDDAASSFTCLPAVSGTNTIPYNVTFCPQ
jgi:hypothetical protein